MVEPGETIQQALVREVLEETGYVVNPGRLTGVYLNLVGDIVSLVFRCSVSAGTAVPTEESMRVTWLDMTDVAELMTEAFAVRLVDAQRDALEGVPIRPHDGNRLLPVS